MKVTTTASRGVRSARKPVWVGVDFAVRWVMQANGWNPPAVSSERYEDGYISWVDDGDIDWSYLPSASDAVAEELESGRLKAFGQQAQFWKEIPAVHWSDREPSVWSIPIACEPYQAIRLLQADIFRIWPLPNEEQSAPVIKAIVKRDIENKFKNRAEDAQKKGIFYSQTEDEQWLRTLGTHDPRGKSRMLRKLYPQAVRARGKPPKSNLAGN